MRYIQQINDSLSSVLVTVKNRHHYALYVHNCKLVLLLREEYSEGVDVKAYKPAEFRWRLPEVCDGEWHHYAVSMNFPNVSNARRKIPPKLIMLMILPPPSLNSSACAHGRKTVCLVVLL